MPGSDDSWFPQEGPVQVFTREHLGRPGPGSVPIIIRFWKKLVGEVCLARAPPSSGPKEVTGGKWGMEEAVPTSTDLVERGCWAGGG